MSSKSSNRGRRRGPSSRRRNRGSRETHSTASPRARATRSAADQASTSAAKLRRARVEPAAPLTPTDEVIAKVRAELERLGLRWKTLLPRLKQSNATRGQRGRNGRNGGPPEGRPPGGRN